MDVTPEQTLALLKLVQGLQVINSFLTRKVEEFHTRSEIAHLLGDCYDILDREGLIMTPGELELIDGYVKLSPPLTAH